MPGGEAEFKGDIRGRSSANSVPPRNIGTTLGAKFSEARRSTVISGIRSSRFAEYADSIRTSCALGAITRYARYVALSLFLGLTSGADAVGAHVAPVNINNVCDLQGIQENLSGSYVLANNIDARNFSCNGGIAFQFLPIGDGTSPFTGTLDGNGFGIRNLALNTPINCVGNALCIGLVGVNRGFVTNLRLEDVSVAGNIPTDSLLCIGAIAGLNDGTISLVSVSGKVKARGSAGSVLLGGIAGVVGVEYKSGVSYSVSTASITLYGKQLSDFSVGGLVGANDNHNGVITWSGSTGSVSASTDGTGSFGVGGLVGYNDSIVSASYAAGSVSVGTNTEAGGLVGRNDNGEIDKSLATGQVQAGAESKVGGLVGWAYEYSVTQSYAMGSASAGRKSSVGGLIGELGNDCGSGCGSVALDQSYSTGAVTAGNGSAIGGLVGHAGAAGSFSVVNSYWDRNTSGVSDPSNGCGNITNCPGVAGLTTQQFQDGTLDNVMGFDPSVWEPMLTAAVQPSRGYYPQLWALPFPISVIPLAGFTPYNVPVITVFDHSLRTSAQAGINGQPLTAALYSVSCDEAVLAFSGQYGLAAYGQDTPTCDEAGYEQDTNGDPFVINGINYTGSNGEGPKYLNYEGHPGFDYRAPFPVPVSAAASGTVFYPWRVVGAGNIGNYDAYCRFHTLAEIPDAAAAYRIYYLHLTTHPNLLHLKNFPPDPACPLGKNDVPGKTWPINAVSGCYTFNGQAFMPTQLPLPPNTHANAGCEIAVSGSAGVPGAHLHFEIQQVVPTAALTQTQQAIINNSQYSFQCWNENDHYGSRNTDNFCLPADPYGWTGANTDCGDVSQWPPNGTYVTDQWACLSSIPSRRFWAQ